jgi:preprotein translocase subunit SecG
MEEKTMKKITAILVMAMFLLSVVPAAFAMEDTEVVKDTVSDAQAKRVAAERIDIMRDKAKERKDRVVDRAKEHRANIRAD